MVANFLAGGAVVNAFAARLGAEVVVVDVGVAVPLDPARRPARRKVRAGTADLTVGPGDDRRRGAAGPRGRHRGRPRRWPRDRGCLITGDMGIANTTAVGRPGLRLHRRRPGGGDRPGHRHRRPDPGPQDRGRQPRGGPGPGAADRPRTRPWRCWPRSAGSSTPALAGFVLGAAAARVPVILDGAIAGSAALVAAGAVPHGARVRAVAGHTVGRARARRRARQPGPASAARPDLRLGEGTGALLALPLWRARPGRCRRWPRSTRPASPRRADGHPATAGDRWLPRRAAPARTGGWSSSAAARSPTAGWPGCSRRGRGSPSSSPR